ncbi:MAG: DNA-directed RNA polymerase subunit A'' [Deltaproteobacteria bacterium]|nr:DNA-directed RNA polymerase subunit A'' [Deltaproteobacteria bacterium]
MDKMPPGLREEIEQFIEKKKLSPSQKEKVVAAIRELYDNSRYDPQEPMGVVCAQSLSEPATQMTMRTYHFAGTAGIQVTLGLPRMMEIFDARKEPRTPTMRVYIMEDYQDIEKVKKIAEQVKEIKAKDVILSTTVDLTELQVKCKLNLKKLEDMGVPKEKAGKIIKMRNVDMSQDGDDVVVIKSKKADLKTMHKLKYSILESHVKGIKGITQVVVSKDEQGEWVINTLGSNLKKVFDIEGVDYTRTYSNNMFEILDVLGIEAARNVIIKQAQYTMEEQGLGVDPRYVMLLADLMSVQGDIRAIGRYGISGQKASVLVRASFEETKKHFTTAAIRGESDPLKGTVENIMINQIAPIGTGAFDLIGRIPESFATEKEHKTKVSTKQNANTAKQETNVIK